MDPTAVAATAMEAWVRAPAGVGWGFVAAGLEVVAPAVEDEPQPRRIEPAAIPAVALMTSRRVISDRSFIAWFGYNLTSLNQIGAEKLCCEGNARTPPQTIKLFEVGHSQGCVRLVAVEGFGCGFEEIRFALYGGCRAGDLCVY